MPDVYRAGKPIGELGGSFPSGTTIVVHEPKDLDDVAALVELASALGASPEVAVHEALKSEPLDLASWPRRLARLRRTLGVRVTPPAPTPTPTTVDPQTQEIVEEPETDIDALLSTLPVARDIWKNQPQPSELAVAFTFADPDAKSASESWFKGSEPVLALSKGSILSTIAVKLRGAPIWTLCFFRRGGLAPSLRGQALVDELRRNALKTVRQPLGRLHDLTGLPFDAKGLVIFIHGLASTDLGTFDPIVEALRAVPNVELAGFPHDTFKGIYENAHELKMHVRRVVDGPRIPVSFVCHSRGGLVARSTIAQLHELSENDHDAATQVGACVTFGTPHLGSALAEWPQRLVSAAMCASGVKGTGSMLSIVDVLGYFKMRKGFPGVTDLQPIGGDSTFLLKLEEAEARLNRRALPRVDLLAIGGRVTLGSVERRIGDHYLATTEHDGIVPLSSSVPKAYRTTPAKWQTTGSDHFGYFSTSESTTHKLAVEHIRQNLATDANAGAIALASGLPPGDDGDKPTPPRPSRRPTDDQLRPPPA